MTLNDIHTMYFIGIGGIGMSALARYFNSHGVEIHGYDRSETELTRALVQEGMNVHYDDDIRHIPEKVDLVVYTPAVPKDHSELNWFLANGVPVKKRAEVLGIISRSKRTVAIGGTHGKTTTSCMTAHLLRACGVDATAFVGGIALNLKSNFAEGQSEWVVVEADEYDRSFLHLYPDVAVINSIDPDHLDIYGTAEAVRDSYLQFAGQVKPGGTLFFKHGLDITLPADAPFRVATFGIDAGDYRASNLRIENEKMVFDLDTPQRRFRNLRMSYPGRHNVENATAAIAAALSAGADPGKIAAALKSFKGVKRRFEYIVRKPNCVYVDDYAHHPAELEAVISAAKALFAGRRVCGIFQPHLYSRTRDFAEGFARALSLLDEVILLDIYPARELPIPGVDSELIFKQITLKNKTLVQKKDLLKTLKNKQTEVLLTMGAGDIDQFVGPIKRLLNRSATQR